MFKDKIAAHNNHDQLESRRIREQVELQNNEFRDPRDKTMDNKLIFIHNDNKQNNPFCKIKLLVEKFEY